MEILVIDKFGRVVIPKAVRVRHGWQAGTALVLRDDEAGVHVESAPQETVRSGLTVRDGSLFFEAEWLAPAGVDAVRDAIEQSRGERVDRIIG